MAGVLLGRTGAGLIKSTDPTIAFLGNLGFAVLMALLVKAAMTREPDWPRVLALWGLASLVYVGFVYGWNLPWLLVPTLTTACVALRTRWHLRLLGLSHALGFLLMLPYALLIKV